MTRRRPGEGHLPLSDQKVDLTMSDHAASIDNQTQNAEVPAERPEHDVQIVGMKAGGVYAWCNTCRWTKGWPRSVSIHEIANAHGAPQPELFQAGCLFRASDVVFERESFWVDDDEAWAAWFTEIEQAIRDEDPWALLVIRPDADVTIVDVGEGWQWRVRRFNGSAVRLVHPKP